MHREAVTTMAESCHSSTGAMIFVLRLSTAVGESGMLLGGVEAGLGASWVAERAGLGASFGLDSAGEVGHLVEETATLGHQESDLPLRVHHRRVIAATEALADLG